MLNILQFEVNMFFLFVILICLLPFSSHHKVRFYGCYIAYTFLCSLGVIFLIPIFLLRLRNVRNCVIGSELLKHISKLIGIQWELRGADILEVERGAVIVANHQTMIDILGIFNIWKIMGKCTVVSKKEVFYVWPFGLAAWMAGIVFIDRNRAKVANVQLDDSSRLVTKEQTKLWIFPEGTRNTNAASMLPFKKGAFRIAVACQAPIIPIVFSPYYFIDHERKYFGRGQIIIHCLEPVPTVGRTDKDIDSIMEEVREKMMSQYELLTQEVNTQKKQLA